MKKLSAGYGPILMLVLAMALIAGCGANAANQAGEKQMKWDKMPDMTIDLNQSYSAVFHTSKGDFTVELFADEAPATVNNFVFLAREGFYDGLKFHRVIESYMIQSGDPNEDGSGNPGYTIPDEFDTDRKFEPGIVAMFNMGKPNTGGSQFFINTGPDSANLNKHANYSIFGKVDTGMETVLAIAGTPVKDSKPLEPVIIESIEIVES